MFIETNTINMEDNIISGESLQQYTTDGINSDELKTQATDREFSEEEEDDDDDDTHHSRHHTTATITRVTTATTTTKQHNCDNEDEEVASSTSMSSDDDSDDDDTDGDVETDSTETHKLRRTIVSDPYLHFDFNSRAVCGITNIGNTCYLNSALQALCSCSQLFNLLQRNNVVNDMLNNHMLQYRKQGKMKSLKNTKLCLLFKAVNQHLTTGSNRRDGECSIISAKDFAYMLWSIFPTNFRPFYQEDSQELIQLLLDTLYEETKTEVILDDIDDDNDINDNNNESSHSHSHSAVDPDELFILRFIRKQQKEDIRKEIEEELKKHKKISKTLQQKQPYKQFSSPVSDIFGGYLLNEVTCHNCNTVSPTAQAILGGLAIEIPESHELDRLYSSSSSDCDEEEGGGVEQRRDVSNRRHNMNMEQQLSYISYLLRFNICECLNPFNIPSLFSSSNSREQSVHLFDCLDSFFHSTTLSGDNLYKCSTCKSKQESSQKLSLIKLPKILCLHIKRFYTAPSTFFTNIFSSGMSCFKRTEKVDFPNVLPVKELKRRYMKNFVPNSPPEHVVEDGEYRLCAVINHHGYGLSSGHYTSFVRVGNNWYLCDDSRITRVSEKRVHDSEAYVLFYELSTAAE